MVKRMVSKDRKPRLLDGYYVLVLTNVPDKAISPASMEVHPAARFLEIYLHIGMVFLSPYRLTFMHMQRDGAVGDQKCPGLRPHVVNIEFFFWEGTILWIYYMLAYMYICNHICIYASTYAYMLAYMHRC